MSFEDLAASILTAEILLGTTLGISLPLLFYVWKKERQDILVFVDSNKQTIALSTVAVAAAIVLFAAGPLVATHQAQAFWGGGGGCGFPGWGWGGGFSGPFFGHFGHFGGGHF